MSQERDSVKLIRKNVNKAHKIPQNKFHLSRSKSIEGLVCIQNLAAHLPSKCKDFSSVSGTACCALYQINAFFKMIKNKYIHSKI